MAITSLVYSQSLAGWIYCELLDHDIIDWEIYCELLDHDITDWEIYSELLDHDIIDWEIYCELLDHDIIDWEIYCELLDHDITDWQIYCELLLRSKYHRLESLSPLKTASSSHFDRKVIFNILHLEHTVRVHFSERIAVWDLLQSCSPNLDQNLM